MKYVGLTGYRVSSEMRIRQTYRCTLSLDFLFLPDQISHFQGVFPHIAKMIGVNVEGGAGQAHSPWYHVVINFDGFNYLGVETGETLSLS